MQACGGNWGQTEVNARLVATKLAVRQLQSAQRVGRSSAPIGIAITDCAAREDGHRCQMAG